MFRWLRGADRREPAPLTGAPPVRRQKTYSADSGYVYQYHYAGYRVAEFEGQVGVEFVFEVSADRKTSFPVSVFLGDEVSRGWEQSHDRDLNSTERYAIAKMALFRGFDQRATPEGMREWVRVRAAEVGEILDQLGID